MKMSPKFFPAAHKCTDKTSNRMFKKQNHSICNVRTTHEELNLLNGKNMAALWGEK